jgi:hypothetical protein|tara:strand:- start:273 stop:500 length:228 start_codon:yes stop_codon:yes gene_type:complete
MNESVLERVCNGTIQREEFRVCPLPEPVLCKYQRGYRSLLDIDDKRKVMPLCEKGWMPIRERIARWYESMLPTWY